MSRYLRAVFLGVVACVVAATAASAASYDSLVQRGQFYLQRGSTYGPDAVRTLEAAEQADAERAHGDPQWLGAMARAYVLTHRYTEGYWLLESLDRRGALDPALEGLREQVLGETGLGRIRVFSAVPVGRLPARLELQAGSRLDVTGRKGLDRLNDLLGRGLLPRRDGLTLLAPEGRYQFICDAPSLAAPRHPVPLEVWAGDEVAVRLTPAYPPAQEWVVAARSRSIELSWPALEAAAYRLFRSVAGQAEEPIYEGFEPAFSDGGLPVGAEVLYRLESRDDRGQLLAVSERAATTLPPVTRVRCEAVLTGDLTVDVQWRLGEGAVDRVRVLRLEDAGEREIAAPPAHVAGEVLDGPFLPETEEREVVYRIESWVADAREPSAVAEARVVLPARVQRVTEVVETIDRGLVVVGWETLPRDGLAEGFLVYRQRDEASAGELVGRVRDPFAREYEYPVEDPLAASDWRHFVVPYIAERLYFDPEWLQVDAAVPQGNFKRRQRGSQVLPDLGLSWDAYPGARVYLVRVGEREELVHHPYVELKGLQNRLAESEYPIAVYGVDTAGEKVPMLRVEVQYLHYPRTLEEEDRSQP